jgi:hypothetical protein
MFGIEFIIAGVGWKEFACDDDAHAIPRFGSAVPSLTKSQLRGVRLAMIMSKRVAQEWPRHREWCASLQKRLC